MDLDPPPIQRGGPAVAPALSFVMTAPKDSDMTVFKFRLLGGQYTDLKNVRHQEGAIFESDTDLRKRWRNKFELVGTEQEAPAEAAPTPPAAPAAPAPAKAKPKPTTPAPAATKAKPKPTVAVTVPTEDTDVTDQHQSAKDADLRVTQKGGTDDCFVYDEHNRALPGCPIKASGVDAFVDAYLSSPE